MPLETWVYIIFGFFVLIAILGLLGAWSGNDDSDSGFFY